MNAFFCAAAGILSGLLGAMGMGGGGVLIIYLSLFTNTPQDQAQGINLLFFLPAAVIALFFHQRKKLIVWRLAIPFALLGILGSFWGAWLSANIDNTMLSKMFGALLLLMGLKTLFSKKQANKQNATRIENSCNRL